MPVLKKRQAEGPLGGAGLIRYFDVDEGGPKLDPKIVIGIVVSILMLTLLFNILLS